MSWIAACGIMFGTVIALMGLGFPVAIAFLLTDLIGVIIFMGGGSGIGQLINNAFSSITSFSLVPIPFFLIMGELFFHTGLGMRVFDALDKMLGGVRARLSYLAVGGGTLFAALSGSSVANTALLGSLMVPEMKKRGYAPVLSIGPILGTGGLAILIPPSALAVLLGSLAQLDIGALLIAGVMPGLLLAFLYILTIFTVTRLRPDAAPAYAVPKVPLGEKVLLFFRDVMPMALVIFAVVGLMLLGWATPTESAAFGVAAVVIVALLFRCLTWDAVIKSMTGALRVTVMTLLIILGSSTFSQILAFSGGGAGMLRWATEFAASPAVLLISMFVILLILGCFMDQLSMMMLTVPIFFPLAKLLGFDLIWFGVIIMLTLEIGFTTPPFGLLLFVMKGVAPAGTTMRSIVLAALPYMACAILTAILIMVFPPLALWLPKLMN
jgi:tripartite ATP-independent transporter DctM subunit